MKFITHHIEVFAIVSWIRLDTSGRPVGRIRDAERGLVMPTCIRTVDRAVGKRGGKQARPLELQLEQLAGTFA